ncbi:MAG: DUF2064 domain-containing protein [Chloroflexi bacterium]|nr:DUF2064 domain-containing protein [Chloroflexota bacterium]
MGTTRLLVIAKAPVPGRVKTRLRPPCTALEAAWIAEAALRDTLDAVADVEGAEPVLVLDGGPGPWLPAGVRVIPQRGAGLGPRLDAAFEDAGTPAVLIGMDTPQATSELLRDAVRMLGDPDVDAVFGEADDGGWWVAGLRRHVPRTFADVEMSTHSTGRRQRLRMRALGLRIAELPRLRDVDTFDDALAVAALAAGGRFAAAVADVAARAEEATA